MSGRAVVALAGRIQPHLHYGYPDLWDVPSPGPGGQHINSRLWPGPRTYPISQVTIPG